MTASKLAKQAVRRSAKRARARHRRTKREGIGLEKQSDESIPEAVPESKLTAANLSSMKDPSPIRRPSITLSTGATLFSQASEPPPESDPDPFEELPQEMEEFAVKVKLQIASYHQQAAAMEADTVPPQPTSEHKEMWLKSQLEFSSFMDVLDMFDRVLETGFCIDEVGLDETMEELSEVWWLEFTMAQSRLEAQLFRMAVHHGMDPVRDMGLPRSYPPTAEILEQARESGRQYPCVAVDS